MPISLYVTVELTKVLQAVFMEFDEKMYHEETNTPMVSRTSSRDQKPVIGCDLSAWQRILGKRVYLRSYNFANGMKVPTEPQAVIEDVSSQAHHGCAANTDSPRKA